MSIAEELNRIQNAKSALKEAINAKGGTLGTETLEHYAQAVYCLKTEGTAVTSSPEFFKCAAVKGATSYNAVQITLGDEGTFPITRSPDLDYPYSYTTPEHLPGTILEATAYGYTYTTEGGGVEQCAMDTDDPKDGDYVYRHGEYIKQNDWQNDGTISIGVYTVVEVPPEWSGYKAVLTDGVYSFEETVTEGLTFGNGFTPVVGKIYDTEAMVEVARLRIKTGLTDPDTLFLLDTENLCDLTGNFEVTTQGEFTTSPGTAGTWLEFPSAQNIRFTSDKVTIGGSSDFTVEFFYKRTGEGQFPPVFSGEKFQVHGGDYGYDLTMWTESNGNLEWWDNAYNLGERVHVAISRRASDGSWKYWVNGQSRAGWVYSWIECPEMTGNEIGNYGNDRVNGFAIEQYRISRVLRYTADTFDVPTEPLN